MYKKILQAILGVTLIYLAVLALPVYAQDDGDGGEEPKCPPPGSLTCEEYQTTVGLKWNKPKWQSGSALTLSGNPTYQVKWYKSGASSTCPAGSSASVCGQIQTTDTSIAIAGLTQMQLYIFEVMVGDTSSGNCSQPGIGASITCTPTICGDNTKGTTEVCDGTDVASLTCSSYGYSQDPQQLYEGGNLTCTNNCPANSTGACPTCNTFSTSSCTACNSLNANAVRADNGIANSAPFYVATDSTFSCYIDASRAGFGVGCDVIENLGKVLSSCKFNAWQGSTAQFTCTAPAKATGTDGISYRLKASYPATYNPGYTSVDPSNPTLTNAGSCPKVPAQDAPLEVRAPDTTPPTVTVVESADSTEALLSAYKNVTASVACADASGCITTNSYRLKSFDTQPTACPADYNQYTLTSPQPTSAKTVWFCAAARDNFANAGFSQPREVRPGCRDQCNPYGVFSCRPSDPWINGVEATSYCANFDSDACYEWWAPGQNCPKYACDTGHCKSSSADRDTGRARVVDENGAGIPNVLVKNTERTIGDGNVMWRDNSGQAGIIAPIVPPGWQLVSTICEHYNGISGTCTNTVAVSNKDSAGNCNMPFAPDAVYVSSSGNPSGEDGEGCGYSIVFGLQKTDNTLPSISFSNSPSPASPKTTDSVSLTVNTSDNAGISDIQIFVDGGLVKRCSSPVSTSGPLTMSCSFTGGPYLEGSYQYYAVSYDTVGNKTTTPVQTVTVTAPPVSVVSSCGTGTTDPRAEGLVSTPSLGGNFPISSTGACIIDPKAAFLPFKIPTLDDLKSLYFDQKR